jgi:ClpP class serine protease
LGSIGVISDIPNVYERLKREGIEFQTVTAGKYKRTLTPTKKVTTEDFAKSKQDVEEIFVLFRDFVAENRPQLDIAKVATGETWFGKAALERKLCDEIKPVDSVLLDYVHKGYNVYEVAYSPPREGAAAFGGLLPGRGSVEDQGLVGKGVRWLVRTIASELEATVTMSGGINLDTTPIEQRYMAVDDQSDRVKMQ